MTPTVVAEAYRQALTSAVLVNAGAKTARKIERVLGRRPETVTWR
jgi:hypothetical protein